jgi:hypothetical protein
MRKFKLPFTYTVNGEIEIEANNLASAISKFNVLAEQSSPTGHFPVLDRATKLVPDTETLEVDEDEAQDINPPIKYKVVLTRTQSLEVEVEAHDEYEAEENAFQKVNEGDYCESSFFDDEWQLDEIEEIANMMEESQELLPAFVAFREARANADRASPQLKSAMVRIEKNSEHEFRKVLFAEQAFAMNMASMMEGHREQLEQILTDYF